MIKVFQYLFSPTRISSFVIGKYNELLYGSRRISVSCVSIAYGCTQAVGTFSEEVTRVTRMYKFRFGSRHFDGSYLNEQINTIFDCYKIRLLEQLDTHVYWYHHPLE
jgi:hypothetical protein